MLTALHIKTKNLIENRSEVFFKHFSRLRLKMRELRNAVIGIAHTQQRTSSRIAHHLPDGGISEPLERLHYKSLRSRNLGKPKTPKFNCRIGQPLDYGILDDAACTALKRRAKFAVIAVYDLQFIFCAKLIILFAQPLESLHSADRRSRRRTYDGITGGNTDFAESACTFGSIKSDTKPSGDGRTVDKAADIA